MKNQPQGTSGTAKNDSGNGQNAEPQHFVFENPNYQCWYADTEKYEAAEANYWRRQNKIGIVGLFVNGFTLAAAIVAGWVAYNAFVQAKRQADEAKRQADAANAQIVIAKDTEKRQLRAYVLVSETNMTVSSPDKLDIRFKFKNFGVTPAHKFNGWHCLIVGQFRNSEAQITLETSFPEPAIDLRLAQRTIIGPQDTKELIHKTFCDSGAAINRGIKADEVTRIQGGTAALYLYGEVHYLDIFEDPHFVKYRVVGLGNGTTFDHQTGNDAD
jgi:hypothetical protein